MIWLCDCLDMKRKDKKTGKIKWNRNTPKLVPTEVDKKERCIHCGHYAVAQGPTKYPRDPHGNILCATSLVTMGYTKQEAFNIKNIPDYRRIEDETRYEETETRQKKRKRKKKKGCL